jgi:hypothetical protein
MTADMHKALGGMHGFNTMAPTPLGCLGVWGISIEFMLKSQK